MEVFYSAETIESSLERIGYSISKRRIRENAKRHKLVEGRKVRDNSPYFIPEINLGALMDRLGIDVKASDLISDLRRAHYLLV
jgi:hypothetical protein